MKRPRRRPSASMALAFAALFCALGGTALAQSGIIISTPDQLGPAVVTTPKIAADAVTSAKIADQTVSQANERNPSLRASIQRDGTGAGDTGGGIDHVKGSNRYDIGFTSSDVGQGGLDDCAFAANPRFDFDQSSGHRALRAYVNHAAGSPTIQVFTFEQRSDGRELPTETAFDVVAAC